MQDTNTTHSKRAILKSTTLLGGSSLINILIGMVKTKIVAILLGPSGVGFMGVLNSLQQIISTVTGFGLNSSGVRQIAYAAANGDEKSVALTVKSLRITVWATGGLGLLVMVFGASLWSQLSFKTLEYAVPIAILGLAVLFSAISAGQSCVLQGFRRIKDVAKINVIGAINGTLIGLPLYYFWGKNGIVPSMVLASLANLVTSWWFSRKVKLAAVLIDFPVVKKEAGKLIVFGMPLMLSTLITTTVNYISIIFINREAGLDAIGQYQAAFTLAGVLVNFVLSAMGTDYYPRLTAIADDNQKVNQEVNAQTEIALLLAVPALAATVAFMPFIMRLFYSSRFDAAIPILRLAVFGILGRIISWPMSIIIVAKRKGGLFFLIELITGIFNILILIICYKLIGLPGTGLAFALLYLWYIGILLIITKKLLAFKWDVFNIKLILASLIGISLLSIIQIIHIYIFIKAIISIIMVFIISCIYFTRLIKVTGLSLEMIKRKLTK